jgi:environmental stress-induced protein Ves
MPRHSLLQPTNYIIQKWKNGTGSTSQIAIEPQTASFPFDPYHWRVSSARVNAAGPFSLFPGYDRLLVLVKGEKLVLKERVQGELRALRELKPFQALTLAGEREIFAEAAGLDLVDYNLFWKRGAVDAQCDVISQDTVLALRLPATRLSVVATVIGTGASLRLGESGPVWHLKDWETLRLDFENAELARAGALSISELGPASHVLIARFGF